MWQIYRKRFLATQILILGICAALRFIVSSPWPNVVVFFGVMQVSGVVGAWYGTRLARKIRDQEKQLPLDRS